VFWVAGLSSLCLFAGLFSADAATESAPPLRVVLFYSSTCHGCQQVLSEVLPAILQRYGPFVEVEEHKIDELAVYDDLLGYERH